MVIVEDMTGDQREAFNRKTRNRFDNMVAKGKRKPHEWLAFKEGVIANSGKAARARVEEGLPALGKLQERVKRLAKKNGELQTLDGGFLKVRSQHSALNTLLQGGGAIVMKKALYLLDERLRADGWEPDRLTGEYRRGPNSMGYVVNVHDEVQLEVPEAYAAAVGQMGKDAIRDAGIAFGCRCALAGSCDIGDSWAETH